MRQTRSAPPPVAGRFKTVIHAVNGIAAYVAGRRFTPLWGLMRHRGRRSGRVYTTPVVLRPIPGGFVVPLPWGPTTDWCRNVLAAGGGQVRWKGHDRTVERPEVVDLAMVRDAFDPFQRTVMARANMTRCLMLRLA
jgi:deazaflavin-dependent oxidoreductase (nitroreductase family)